MQRSALLRSRQELSNEYLLAKFGVDTEERTSPVKFAHLAEKSGKGSISNLSTKVSARALHVRGPRGPEEKTSAQAPPAATPQLPPSETQPAAAGGVESDDWGPCWSRRAAAGRAELLANFFGGAVYSVFRENANCGDPPG